METQKIRRVQLRTIAVLICSLFLVILFFDWYFFHRTFNRVEVVRPNIDSLKHRIDSLVTVGDSLKKEALKRDSVRTVEVIKWSYLKQNPDTLPCDTFVKLIIAQCDTVILKDSVEIASLKTVISNQDSIISYQGKVIKLDSVEIVTLNREVKKQKRQKRIFAAGAGVALLIAIFK